LAGCARFLRAAGAHGARDHVIQFDPALQALLRPPAGEELTTFATLKLLKPHFANYENEARIMADEWAPKAEN